MKKSLWIAVAVVGFSAGLVWAGHFTDLLPPAQSAGCVPIANGYDWNCASDNYSPGPTFSTTTVTGGLTLRSATAAQYDTITPTAAGQIGYCSDCSASKICVSTGTGAGAWVVVSTNTAATLACQ